MHLLFPPLFWSQSLTMFYTFQLKDTLFLRQKENRREFVRPSLSVNFVPSVKQRTHLFFVFKKSLYLPLAICESASGLLAFYFNLCCIFSSPTSPPHPNPFYLTSLRFFSCILHTCTFNTKPLSSLWGSSVRKIPLLANLVTDSLDLSEI